jgi:hypothetical protein
MFLIAFIVLGVAIVIARLVTDIRNDRPLTPPRSHTHAQDTYGSADVQTATGDTR